MCVLTIKNETVEDCGKYIFKKIFFRQGFIGASAVAGGNKNK